MDPDEIIDVKRFWRGKDGTESPEGADPTQGWFGMGIGQKDAGAVLVERQTYADGEIYEVEKRDGQWGEPHLIGVNKQLQARYEAETKRSLQPPTVREAPDGTMQQWNPNTQKWEAAPGMPGPKEPDSEDAELRRRLLEAQVAKAEAGPAGPSPRQSRWPEEEEYDQLRNQELRGKLEGTLEPSAWDKANLLYTRGKAEEKTTYDRTQDELERQRLAQTLEMQRRDAAWKAATELLSQRRQAANVAMLPGQQYFLGWQPGGIAENIAKLSGRSYNPDNYRVPAIQYDENDAWRQAWGKMGG